jgi:hypothetical protein
MVLSVVLNMVIVKMYGLVVGFGSFHGIELLKSPNPFDESEVAAAHAT